MRHRKIRSLFAVPALLLTAVLFVTCLSGCNDTKQATVGGINVDGVLQRPNPVLAFGSDAVSFDYYRYLYLTQKDQMAGDDADYFKTYPKMADQLKEAVYKHCRYVAGFYRLLREYNVSLTDDEKKAVSERLAENQTRYEESNRDSFSTALGKIYLTQAVYEQLQQEDELETKLQNTLFLNDDAPFSLTDDAVVTKIISDFRRVRHIQCKTKAEAEAAKAALDSGTSFDTVLAKYNQDATMEDNTEGRYLTADSFLTAYGKGVAALKENAYSDILTGDGGYYIVLRMPITKETVQVDIESFRQRAYSAVYDALLESSMENIEPTYCSVYDRISPDSLS